MEIEGLEEALGRPGYDKDGKRRTFNHRVVRRYMTVIDGQPEVSYLEVTEVHYEDGKPDTFAVHLGPPCAGGYGLEDAKDADLLAELRLTLQGMTAALDKPILDEKADFPQEVEEDNGDG
jgi:hypothetical protein